MKKIMFLLSLLIVFNSSSVIFAAQKTKQIYSRAAGIEATPQEHPIAVVDFATVVGTGITVDTVNNVITLGGNVTQTAGAIWYAGDADTANCSAGNCYFNSGIRVYFEFTFCNNTNCTTPYNADNDANSGTYADGFNFVISNGSNNNTALRAGAPTGVNLGELGGYAGPDNTTDELGIHHPKMSIEFDTFWNTGAMVYNGCSGGRNDGSGATYGGNHIALLLWGAENTGNCNRNSTAGNSWVQSSFDDNVHGAGGTTGNPINSAAGNRSGCVLDPTNLNPSTTSACGYYNVPKVAGSANWLEDAVMHRFRMEIRRASALNGNGNYNYDIAVWIDCPSCTSDQLNTFKNLNTVYTALNPKIYRRVEISPADHVLFNTMYWGFAQSTGDSTQNVKIENFVIYFDNN